MDKTTTSDLEDLQSYFDFYNEIEIEFDNEDTTKNLLTKDEKSRLHNFTKNNTHNNKFNINFKDIFSKNYEKIFTNFVKEVKQFNINLIEEQGNSLSEIKFTLKNDLKIRLPIEIRKVNWIL